MRARPRAQRAARNGFSLLEIMNGLALLCVVSALAMYFVARYVRHAKTAEAVGSVSNMAEGAVGAFERSDSMQPAGTHPEAARAMRHFPPTSRTSVPANQADVGGKRYQSTLADWSISPWVDLHFSIPQPQFYAYSFESQGHGAEATATATAHGDLDANGIMSTYSLTVAPDAQLRAVVSPTMERANAEE